MERRAADAHVRERTFPLQYKVRNPDPSGTDGLQFGEKPNSGIHCKEGKRRGNLKMVDSIMNGIASLRSQWHLGEFFS